MRTLILIIIIIGPLLFASLTSAQDNEPQLLIQTELGDGVWESIWSPDSTKVAVYRRIDALLYIYAVLDQTTIYDFASEHNIQDMAWMPDGTQLLIGTTEGVVHVVDLETGFFLTELFHPDAVYLIRVSEDGERALISGGFGTARVWDIGASFVEFELDPEELVYRAFWDEDLERIRTFSNDGYMHIWDAQTGDQLLTIQHDDWIYGSTWNADGSQIITYGQDRTARITDIEAGEIMLELPHDDVVYDARWIQDEAQLLTYSGDGFIHIWTLDGTEIRALPYRGFDLLEDGTIALSRSGEHMVMWNVTSGDEIVTFAHESNISGSEINVEGTRLLTWTMDRIGRIWDMATGDEVWRFVSPLRQAQWSPDGSMVLTITEKRVLEIWDVRTP